MNKNIDDLWQFWGFKNSNDSNAVIRTVDDNVIRLVNLILKEEPTTLVQVGRKAAHLIREYKTQIEAKKFLTCLIIIYNFNELSAYKPEIPKDKPVILIEDTIHHGMQLANVLIALKDDNIQVNKVFCYLKNQKGVDFLVKNGLLKSNQVESLFTSHSEREYQEKAKELHAYFRSHIEPTDPEICYNVYKISTQLSAVQLINIVEPPLTKMFGADSTEEVVDRGFAPNIKEVSYKTLNNGILQKWANSLINKNNDYKVLGLNVRFKINQRLIDSDFSVIPKIEADCAVGEDVNNQKCLTHEGHCMINHCTHEHVDLQKLKNAVCPQCLDIAVSDYLLNLLDNELVTACKKAKLELTLKEKNRPIDFL